MTTLHTGNKTSIYLGVTGHRFLADPGIVRKDVLTALDRIEQYCADKTGNISFTLLSPLAEGADQLVAELVLARPDSQLIVLLPFSAEDYLAEFGSESAKKNFRRLLTQATKTILLPSQPDRSRAYETVGRYVVDHCDVLLAIWDGRQSRGRGGTAEIVAYARRRFRPLYWIQTERPGRIRFENIEEKIR